MKKHLLFLSLLAMPFLSTCQIFNPTEYADYVVYKNGKTQYVDFIEEGKKSVKVFDSKEVIKISKDKLSEFHDGKLWNYQLPYNENGRIEFSEVVPVESIIQNELYLRAKRCFTTMFKDSKKVLELDDKELGMLTGTGNMSVLSRMYGFTEGPYSTTIWFELTIEVKDGKYRVTMTNFERDVPPSQYFSGGKFAIDEGYRNNPELNGNQRQFKKDLLREINDTFLTVKKLMSEKSTKDW